MTSYPRSRSLICERLELSLEVSSVISPKTAAVDGWHGVVLVKTSSRIKSCGRNVRLRQCSEHVPVALGPALWTPHEGNFHEAFESVHKAAGVRCDIDGKHWKRSLRMEKQLTSQIALRIGMGQTLPARPQMTTSVLGCPSLSTTKMLKDARESMGCVFAVTCGLVFQRVFALSNG